MNSSIVKVEIRLIREKLKLSQRDFGELFGLSESMINRIEKGTRKFPEADLPKLRELQSRMVSEMDERYLPQIPKEDTRRKLIAEVESEVLKLSNELLNKKESLLKLNREFHLATQGLNIFSPARTNFFDEEKHLRQIKAYQKRQLKKFLQGAPEHMQLLRIRIDVLEFTIAKLNVVLHEFRNQK